MTTAAAPIAVAPRSRRRRKTAAVACLILSLTAAGSILLPDRKDDDAAADGSRYRTGETRILPSRSAAHGSSPPSSARSVPASAALSSAPSVLRGVLRGISDNSTPPTGHRTVRTFYQPLPQYTPDQRAQHDGQVDLWRSSWTEAGWDARVLTLDDARRHPRYDEFMARIDALDWCGPEGRKAEFQKSCFVRWMAYSSDGAGYVSDYDILPLSFGMSPHMMGDDAILPNNGAFTAYDPILASFASSGSGEEYERVLEAMLDAAEEHRKPRRPGEENLGPAGRRSRGTECPPAPGDAPNNRQVDETKWQITDMQALQIIKYAMWKGSAPPNTLYVPAVQDMDRPPCTFVVNEIDFEEWTMSHPHSCPGAVHFSGKVGMERDWRLETARNMWEDWKELCRTRKECAVPRGEGKVKVEGRRGVMLNVAAWASVVAATVAAMA